MTQPGTFPPTTKFCSSCGNGLIATAVLCPRCGSPTVEFGRSRGKDKTVAVLLAIFLGGWAWAYLYEKCKKKFWWFLGSYVAVVVAFVVGFSTLFGTVRDQCQFNESCQPHFGAGLVVVAVLFGIAWLWGIGMHIYSIVDVATKKSDWYESF